MYKFTLPHTPSGCKMPSRHSALRTEYWKWTGCLIQLDRILPVKFEKWVNQLQAVICMLFSSPNQQWQIWLTYICRTLQILTKLVVSVLWLSVIVHPSESCTAGRRLRASASVLFFPGLFLMSKLKVDKAANHL